MNEQIKEGMKYGLIIGFLSGGVSGLLVLIDRGPLRALIVFISMLLLSGGIIFLLSLILGLLGDGEDNEIKGEMD